MSYTVIVLQPAQKDLGKLSTVDGRRVKAALSALKQEPRPHGCIRLTGSSQWRIRVGDIRVLYRIDDPGHIIHVVRVLHRDKAYN